MKIHLDMVGCRLNQSEIEAYACQFRAAGHCLVASPSQADVVVINTCAVTSAAESDSRQKIHQAARLGAKQIVVTGCWSTLNPQAAASLPGVSRLVHNAQKDSLVAQVLQIPAEDFDLEFIERTPIPGARQRQRAFIKVQEGCNNRCTFCITTLARGPSRSRSKEQVLENVHAALRGGSREIVLTGVHLGSWGHDFRPRTSLADLVQAILSETEVPRLRLSSLEPWDLQPTFFELWRDKRLCRHLHLPLQSGCAATLRRMARKITPEDYAALVEAARCAIPGLAVTTDVIVGFPGEDEEEFSISLEFVRAMRFAGGHVFSYSARPGTAAAQMPGQVPFPVRKARNKVMRNALASAAAEFRHSFVGKELPVLWERALPLGSHRWEMQGLTDNYLRVSAQACRQLENQITLVNIIQCFPEGLCGEILSA